MKDAHDFFKYCRDYYQTTRTPGCCQHYHVAFKFIRPSDIRRHEDADLDQAFPGTHNLYSVCNTPEALTLKVRSIPCLCRACILDNGEECMNSEHADPWKLVKLIPEKGANKKKYQKRKRLDAHLRMVSEENENVNASDEVNENCAGDSDAEVSEISMDFEVEDEKNVRRKKKKDHAIEGITTVTDQVADMECVTDNSEITNDAIPTTCQWRNVSEEITEQDFISSDNTDEDVEVIDVCERIPTCK